MELQNIQTESELHNEEIDQVLMESRRGVLKEKVAMLWTVFDEIEGDRAFDQAKLRVKYGPCDNLRFDIRSVIYGKVEEFLLQIVTGKHSP